MYMRMRGFKYAYDASLKSDYHAQHLGAVLMYAGKVIAIGYNSEKTHSNQGIYNALRGFDPQTNANKLHAEMMVLNKVQYLDIDFAKAELYVCRGTLDKPQLSKPCAACEARIREMGIKRVFYTGSNSFCAEKYV